MVGIIEKVSELTAMVFLPKEMVQADGDGGWGEGAGKGSVGPRGGEQLCPVAPHPSLTPAHISQLLERKKGTEEANSPFPAAQADSPSLRDSRQKPEKQCPGRPASTHCPALSPFRFPQAPTHTPSAPQGRGQSLPTKYR